MTTPSLPPTTPRGSALLSGSVAMTPRSRSQLILNNPSQTQTMQEPFYVNVLYSYNATDSKQISIKQHEKIKVVQQHSSGWWIGENSKREVGLFPSNYVAKISGDDGDTKKIMKPKEYRPDLADEEQNKKKSLADSLGFDDAGLSSEESEEEEEEGDEELADTGSAKTVSEERYETLRKEYEKLTLEKSELAKSLDVEKNKNDMAERKNKLLFAQVKKLSTSPSPTAGTSASNKQLDELRVELELKQQELEEKDKMMQEREAGLQQRRDEVDAATRKLEALKLDAPKATPKSSSPVSKPGVVSKKPTVGSSTTTGSKVQEEKIKKLQLELKQAQDDNAKLKNAPTQKVVEQDPKVAEKLKQVQEELKQSQADLKKAQANSQASTSQSTKNNEQIQQLQQDMKQVQQELKQAQIDLNKSKLDNTAKEKEIDQLNKQLAQANDKYTKDMKVANDKLNQKSSSAMAAQGTKFRKLLAQVRAIKSVQKELKTTVKSQVQDIKLNMHSLSKDGIGQLLEAVAEVTQKYLKEVKARRALFNEIQELKGNIRVYVRVRPILPSDGDTQGSCIECEKDALTVRNVEEKKNYKYEFEKVFGQESQQAQVFEDVKPLATSVLDGYNVCIFAYGQTGSGKTHTMEGNANDRGVNYRTLGELFNIRDERKGDYKFDVNVSVMEIYNETLFDLLDKQKQKLDILLSGAVSVPNLTSVPVNSPDDVIKTLQLGYKNRIVGANNINEHSSRSHCIVCITITSTNLTTKQKTQGKLHLIDLAGSERLKRTDVKGDRLKESLAINKSLSCLGDVILALSQKKGHIPYRNSKLTSLLQDSLGGNSKTLMFVNVSPTIESCPETLCSLGFAARVKTVELGKAEKNTVK